MKRRILLVDDEVAILLTMKAVLEISGFDVDTAASAREGKMKLRKGEYHMVITDMRMENDQAGRDVIHAARSANYHPAVALLTAFPVEEESWHEMGADKMLVKPMHTRVLLKQIEQLFTVHEAKLTKMLKENGMKANGNAASAKKSSSRTVAAKKPAPSKAVSGKPSAKIAAKASRNGAAKA